jgi:hypothetical protein
MFILCLPELQHLTNPMPQTEKIQMAMSIMVDISKGIAYIHRHRRLVNPKMVQPWPPFHDPVSTVNYLEPLLGSRIRTSSRTFQGFSMAYSATDTIGTRELALLLLCQRTCRWTRKIQAGTDYISFVAAKCILLHSVAAAF